MFTVLVAALTGLIAGGAHVFTGVDHFAAVAPLTLDDKHRAWRTGLFWGIGHCTGVWGLGLGLILFRDLLAIEWLSHWSEQLVGFVLVGIGCWGLRNAIHLRIHSHTHEHDGVRHTHIHLHDKRSPHPHPAEHAHTHSSLAVGTLHGLAGASHLYGILPTLWLPTHGGALAYVVAFGVGSVAAMTAFAWLLGKVASRVNHPRHVHGQRLLHLACSALSLLVGGYWILHTAS